MTGPSTDRTPKRPNSLALTGTQSLVDFSTPALGVSAFCRAVLSKLIPDKFWGHGPKGLVNKGEFLHKVDRFVRLRRFESMSLHVAFQGLEVISNLRAYNFLG